MSITGVVQIAGSIGGVASAAGSIAKLFGASGGWSGSLRQASYGGLPFGVEATRTVAGRRNVLHEYPYRDESWVEDTGKMPSRLSMTGFLIEDSVIYGGGDVIAQRNRMFNLCVKKGVNTLVHPTFGTVTDMTCINVEFFERKDMGRVIEVAFTFMKAGVRIFPKANTSTTAAVASAASGLTIGSLLDFVKSAANAIQKGAAIVQAAVSAAVGFYQMAVTAIHDVKRFLGAISTLSGNFGRLFGGGNNGYLGTNQKAPAGTTVSTLINNDTVLRSAVASAGTALQSAAANVSDTAAFGAAAQSFVQAIAASASDPADAIRILSAMATYNPASVPSSAAIGAAIGTMTVASGALFRRTVIAQLGIAASAYQPSSQQDSQSLTTNIAAVIDSEIEIAGDSGDDESYTALRALRQAVIADLQARSEGLSSTTTFNFSAALPALVLANRIYRDAGRSDGLVQQSDAVHPAFLPISFQALAT